MSRRALVKVASQIAANYRSSSLVEEHSLTAGPRAGERAPDARIRSVNNGASMRLFDLFGQGRHALLLLSSHGFESRSLEFGNDLFKMYTISDAGLNSGDFTDHSGSVAAHYGLESAAYLVRPDGYVAFRCALSDASRLLPDYLARVFLLERDVQLKVA